MNTDKNTIERGDSLKNVLSILRETFEGSPEGEASAYLGAIRQIMKAVQV